MEGEGIILFQPINRGCEVETDSPSGKLAGALATRHAASRPDCQTVYRGGEILRGDRDERSQIGNKDQWKTESKDTSAKRIPATPETIPSSIASWPISVSCVRREGEVVTKLVGRIRNKTETNRSQPLPCCSYQCQIQGIEMRRTGVYRHVSSCHTLQLPIPLPTQ